MFRIISLVYFRDFDTHQNATKRYKIANYQSETLREKKDILYEKKIFLSIQNWIRALINVVHFDKSVD